jgi:hypothetical protein
LAVEVRVADDGLCSQAVTVVPIRPQTTATLRAAGPTDKGYATHRQQ